MKVKTMTVVLFEDFGQYPLSGKCQFYVGLKSPTGSICGKPGVGVFRVGDQEAHVLCHKHAEDVFLQMIGASN